MFFIFHALQDIALNEPDIERLISEYSKGLVRLCYMLLKDVHLAEEAAWDTLYRAYRGYSRFRKESIEKTWITKIAINVCKNYMRKASYKELADSDYISLNYASNHESLAEFRSLEAVELLNSVHALPEKYRQVILLRYYEQMSIVEISKLLNEKQNTISVRIRRAQDLLKQALKEE
jgi:RNA polymerase sigma-70 factor, ECF subfamily